MPHTLDENDDSVSQNMVSNLPLLFAAGYPTSLGKISESQLEKFIPFMVQCSLGCVQIHTNIDCSEPEWWPENVPFSIPLIKTKDSKSSWHAKLKEIVIICYSFHKSIFLLRFCNELAAYQPECLRFINNYNSTTSLFDRVSNKLLVTFRNENMLYDQLPINNKKTLLPRVPTLQSLDDNERMVEAALFDIYLCDNCEAELYSLDAYMEHEKSCQPDDDVIYCGSEELDPIDANSQKQSEFLQLFNLFNKNIPKTKSPIKTKSINKELVRSPEEKQRRLPRNSRASMLLTKCPVIAISSPAGQQLLKNSKTIISNEYLMDRLDRVEKFCHAPPIGIGCTKPKFFQKKPSHTNISCTFKSPRDYHYHYYKFPRRQFSQKCLENAYLHLNSDKLKQCKPLSISVKKLTLNDIEGIHLRTKLDKLNEIAIAILPKTNATKTKKTKVVDFIDLCSSDDDDDIINETINKAHILDGSLSQTAATPSSSQKLINPQPLQPSVFIFSNTTQTSMSLANHQLMYKHQNEENNCSFLNGAKSGPDPALPIYHNKLPSVEPDVVIERNASIQLCQISIDLT